MTIIKIRLVVLLILAGASGIIAQKNQNKSGILIEYAGSLVGAEKRLGKNVKVLKENVKLRHLQTRMFCDSAIIYSDSNKVNAYGSIHVIQNDTIHLYGDILKYDGNEELAKVRDNVRMVNKNVVLTTHFLDYNRRDDVAYYFNGGKIVDDENQLTSQMGFYYPRTGEVNFKDSVVVVNPDYTMHSDTLIYFTKTEVVEIAGPTHIISDKNTIYSELGFYDTRNDYAELLKNNIIDGGEQTLKGDTILYDRKDGIGEVFSSMALEDTANNVIISGNYGFYNELTEEALATRKAVLKQVYGVDTLFLHADTLRADVVSDDPDNKIVRAYWHVKFFRHDLQGRCDSMVYDSRDSTNTFYHDPIIWAQGNQMTAGTIKLFTSDMILYIAEMINNAFLIAPEDSIHFNQIKGKLMTGYFNDNELYRIDVDGNGQTVYYPEDRDFVIGVNRAESSNLSIFLKDREVDTIILHSQPAGNMNPPFVLDKESTRLDGFQWLEEYRPKKYADIFKFETIENKVKKTDYSEYQFNE
jgi:lipopolysaccharide export system protein LptA